MVAIARETGNLGSEAGLADSGFADDPDPSERFVVGCGIEYLGTAVEFVRAAAEQLPSVDLQLLGEHRSW